MAAGTIITTTSCVNPESGVSNCGGAALTADGGDRTTAPAAATVRTAGPDVLSPGHRAAVLGRQISRREQLDSRAEEIGINVEDVANADE